MFPCVCTEALLTFLAFRDWVFESNEHFMKRVHRCAFVAMIRSQQTCRPADRLLISILIGL